MEHFEFDEVEFFRAVQALEVRALLIGRRALAALGLPVLTADYNFQIHIDDIQALNGALEPFGLTPTKSPQEARRTGRYVLENGEIVDVLVARSVPTVEGVTVAFDDVWKRRPELNLTAGVRISLPSLDDLIATKRFAARPKGTKIFVYSKSCARKWKVSRKTKTPSSETLARLRDYAKQQTSSRGGRSHPEYSHRGRGAGRGCRSRQMVQATLPNAFRAVGLYSARL